MRILCLYNNPCALELFGWLSGQGHETVLCQDRVDSGWCLEQGFDLTVSYTYRHILPQDVLGALGNNAVNIHNSYLPWNRGADPNIWSILDGTPRGVTLHYMDAGLDKGDIIAQRLVTDDVGHATLASSYRDLDKAAKQLFRDAFRYYGHWQGMRKKPCGMGTYHSAAAAKGIREMILSYEVSVAEFRELYGRQAEKMKKRNQ